MQQQSQQLQQQQHQMPPVAQEPSPRSDAQAGSLVKQQ